MYGYYGNQTSVVVFDSSKLFNESLCMMPAQLVLKMSMSPSWTEFVHGDISSASALAVQAEVCIYVFYCGGLWLSEWTL